jgi:hypothetical protein
MSKPFFFTEICHHPRKTAFGCRVASNKFVWKKHAYMHLSLVCRELITDLQSAEVAVRRKNIEQIIPGIIELVWSDEPTSKFPVHVPEVFLVIEPASKAALYWPFTRHNGGVSSRVLRNTAIYDSCAVIVWAGPRRPLMTRGPSKCGEATG